MKKEGKRKKEGKGMGWEGGKKKETYKATLKREDFLRPLNFIRTIIKLF